MDEVLSQSSMILSSRRIGKLATALDAAFIKLQEFAYDRNLRRNDPAFDRAMRDKLNRCLEGS
jgi:hypothetical protein